jgi:hypothetical protein
VAIEREIAMHKLCAVIKNFQQLKKTLTIVPLLHMFNANRVVIAVVASVKHAQVFSIQADTTDKHAPQTVQHCPNTLTPS